jgi:hypothetical protein
MLITTLVVEVVALTEMVKIALMEVQKQVMVALEYKYQA